MTAKFMELVDISAKGLVVKGSSELEALQTLMRETGNGSRELHEAMGAAMREPVRLLSRYQEWANSFFMDWPVAYLEDNRIPLDQPIGTAFVSSPEGRAVFITPGTQLWVRPSFFEVKGALRIYWKTLQTAGWPILARRLEETADDMARKRDNAAKAILDTGVASIAGHSINSTGSVLSKTAVDTIIKAGAAIGYPVTQMAINPSRLADMTAWTNVGGSQVPFFFSPEAKRDEVFTKLWAEGYAGLRYVISHNIPTTEVYLSGDATAVGYHQQHGGAQSASDVNIEDGVDLHVVREDHAYYLANAYNIWKITITA